MGVGQILTDFSGWTSAHGIPHIGSSTNCCMKSFWAIIFVGSTGMFAFQMCLLVEKYTAFDVTVQTELKFEERKFPAVTVCNLNPYKWDIVKIRGAFKDMKKLMTDYGHSLDNRSFILNDTWGFKNINANDSIALQAKAREHLMFLGRHHQFETEDINQIVYGLDDFVVNCAYNTKPCDVAAGDNSDFKTFVDPIYGNCFTFNYAMKYNSTRAGPLYGLRILAMSKQSDYLPLIESAGIRVAVHSQNEEPFPDAFGYNAASGFTTSFGIKYIRTERLPAPYGNCSEATKTDDDYYYDGDYAVEGCFRSCYQKNVIDECKCADPRFKKPASASYCDYDNAKDRTCVAGFSGQKSKFDAIGSCSCRQPCTESTFSVTVSTALWPSDVYRPPDCKEAEKVPESCNKWYGRNTVMMEVYYERMNYQMLSESEAYTLVNLISDMGGQLGLWMGFSVITVVEFMSLSVIMVLYLCSGGSKGADPNASQSEVESIPEKVDPYADDQFAPDDVIDSPPAPAMT